MTREYLQRWPSVSTATVTLCLLLGSEAAYSQSPEGRSIGGAPRAGTLDFALLTGLSWSDNVGRLPVDEEDGTLGRVGFSLLYEKQTTRLRANADANVAYERYFDGTFDGEIIGGLNGLLVLGLVRERFEWIFQENFAQTRVNPFAGETPDNREDLGFFTTGPDISLSFGSATSMKLSGRYSMTDYETTDMDEDRYGGTLALVRRLTQSSSVSINGATERFKFENASLNTDYDRHEAFLRYEVQATRTGIVADLGSTIVEQDSESSDGVLARLTLSRKLSPASTVTLNVGTEFSNASDMFRSTQTRNGVTLEAQTVLRTSDPFESRYAFLDWDFDYNRTALGLAAEYREEQYENIASLDRSVSVFSAEARRTLTRVLSLMVYGRFEQSEFDNADFHADELHVGSALEWMLGRALKLRLQYDHSDRESSSSETEYTENIASIMLFWSPLASR